MDIDLFQGILLGLLAIGLVVLIGLLAVLTGIRKALDGQNAAAAPASAAQPVATEPEPVQAAASTSEPDTTRTEPEPAQAAAAVTARAQEPSEATAQADTIRAVLSQHGVTGTTPAAAATPASEVAEPASVVAAHIDTDEPDEEPFQRDGRWWFKRGGELLVYNEGTAQWEPAERPTHWPASTASATTAAASTASTTVSAGETTSPQPVTTASSSGWKCPSCGAINGSTATSCRMCFTARP